jgi:hypothetical protein
VFNSFTKKLASLFKFITYSSTKFYATFTTLKIHEINGAEFSTTSIVVAVTTIVSAALVSTVDSTSGYLGVGLGTHDTSTPVTTEVFPLFSEVGLDSRDNSG